MLDSSLVTWNGQRNILLHLGSLTISSPPPPYHTCNGGSLGNLETFRQFRDGLLGSCRSVRMSPSHLGHIRVSKPQFICS